MPATFHRSRASSPPRPADAERRHGLAPRWKTWIVVLSVAAALMILTPRLWVKNKHAHMVYAGQVTTGFRLYHGWGNRFLVTPSGADLQDSGAAILIDPATNPPTAYLCRPTDYFDLKLFVLGKTLPSGCTRIPGGETRLSDSELTFRTPSGAEVEVTWERPW